MYLASDPERAYSKADTCSALMANAGSFLEVRALRGTQSVQSWMRTVKNTMMDFEAALDWPSR